MGNVFGKVVNKEAVEDKSLETQNSPPTDNSIASSQNELAELPKHVDPILLRMEEGLEHSRWRCQGKYDKHDVGGEKRYNVWYRHDGQPEPEYSRINWHWMTEHEIRRDVGDHSITHMYIADSNIPENMCSLAPNLRVFELRSLDSFLPLQFDRLVGLTKIEKLVHTDCRFAGEVMPPAVYQLTSLKQIDFSRCFIKKLDGRMGNLVHLESLNIRYSQSFSYESLDCGISKLRSLKKLKMSCCNVTDIPNSFSQLKKLQVLDIRYNKFSGGLLPDAVCELISLTELFLEDCGLTALNEKLVQLQSLEILELNGNMFNSWTIPPEIYQLINLRELWLRDCSISRIDERLSNLSRLELLDLGGEANAFTHLPSGIAALQHLVTLRLNRLTGLLSLSPDLVHLPKLKEVKCDDCTALKSPPYAVCKQGLAAIIQYYDDFKVPIRVSQGIADADTSATPMMSIIAAAVIGNRMAGKTSLIRSLKAQKRELTYRDVNAVSDETTKVFEVNEVAVGSTKLRLFDLGGDNVYHLSYQLAIRDNCIPMVVVNIKQFQERATLASAIEAARQLCMNFMSHLYISCPRLGPPLLIVTHKDCLLSDNEFATTFKLLLECLESLRRDILVEERSYSRNTSLFCQIEHFKSEDKPLFHPDDIFVFGGDLNETANIQSLIAALERRCGQHVDVIPQLWELIMKYIEQRNDVPFIRVTDILKKFKHKSNVVVLRYMHNMGRVVWFERADTLKDIIFHRLSVMTDMITVLYHHRSEHLWAERARSITPYYFQEKWISKPKYQSLVKSFLESGVMDEAILFNLYDSQGYPTDVALSLLQTFFLICGPVQAKPRCTYIIPYFSPVVIPASPPSPGMLRLMTDILFIGLPPPVYVYTLMTVAYLHFYVMPGCRIQAAKNGAVVHHGERVSTLLHNHTSCRVTLMVDTPVQQLDESWKEMMDVIEYLLNRLMSVWVAARPICEFYCAHCVHVRVAEPDKEVDPDWYTTPVDPEVDALLTERLESFRGVSPVSCCNDRCNGGPLTVPRPLRYPCMNLTDQEKQKVGDYLAGLDVIQNSLPQPLSIQAAPAVAAPPAAGPDPQMPDTVTTESVNELVQMMRTLRPYINLQPTSTSDTAHAQVTRYQQTSPPGRALILSNKFEVPNASGRLIERRGAQLDFANLKRMLEVHSFITTGIHRNYTSKEIVEAIHRETQLVDDTTGESVHKDLGMFILVLTSHGSEGSIAGVDYKNVKLTDIYDMLSPRNFPAMRGKPKLIIIQACSGDKREMLLDHTDSHQSTTAVAHVLYPSVSDLLILQSSFDSFASPRSPGLGSPFIRALVITFYKYSDRHHLETLAEIIREAVSRYGVERTEEHIRGQQSRAGHAGQPPAADAYVAQMPRTTCTFTDLRKLYIKPANNAAQGGQSANPPRYPDNPDTQLEWLPDVVATELVAGTGNPKTAHYIKWKLIKSTH